MLKNCNPSSEHKFVTKTRDQPEPGCFIPRSLWDEEMGSPWERGCLSPTNSLVSSSFL